MAQGKRIPDSFWHVDFLEAYKGSVGNVTAACKALNISPQAYYKRLHDDPELFKKIRNITDRLCLPALEDIARSKALRGDNTMLLFFLRNLGGARWNQDKAHIELSKREARTQATANYYKRLDEEQRPPTKAQRAAAAAYLKALEEGDDEEDAKIMAEEERKKKLEGG